MEHHLASQGLCIFHPDKLLGPGGWVVGGRAPHSCLHLLILLLSLAVGLGVKARGKTCGSKETANQETRDKLGAPGQRRCLWRPFSLNTWLSMISAVSLVEDSLGRGMNCAVLEKRSMTVRMTVLQRRPWYWFPWNPTRIAAVEEPESWPLLGDTPASKISWHKQTITRLMTHEGGRISPGWAGEFSAW